MSYSFPCYQCGKCCSNVHLSDETKFLDRGDGCCKHLDLDTKLCSIYEDRPDICRVELQYLSRFSKLYAWDHFVELNLEICAALPERISSDPQE